MAGCFWVSSQWAVPALSEVIASPLPALANGRRDLDNFQGGNHEKTDRSGLLHTCDYAVGAGPGQGQSRSKEGATGGREGEERAQRSPEEAAGAHEDVQREGGGPQGRPPQEVHERMPERPGPGRIL